MKHYLRKNKEGIMKKVRVFFMCMVVIISCCLLINSAAAESINAYMAISPEGNKMYVNLIKEKTGIDVQQTMQSCGETEAKMKAEAPNFNADMAIVCGPQSFLAKKSGWAVAYKSPSWSGVSKVFVEPDGFWYNIGLYSFVIIGNKDRLNKAGYTLPKSWKDLLDPKWKDEIVMPSPLTSGGANMMRYSFLSLYGETEGWKYLEALDKNIHHYTRSGSGPANLVARGEFMLGITGDENVYGLIAQGYPVVWTIPEEGTGYDSTVAFILKGTKKLDLCKKVIDFLGSPESSKLMGQIGQVSPRNAVSSLHGTKTPKYIDNLDLVWANDNKARWNEIWKTRFREGQK
jgi:iron(III) transport system substrate-binding protein